MTLLSVLKEITSTNNGEIWGYRIARIAVEDMHITLEPEVPWYEPDAFDPK